MLGDISDAPRRYFVDTNGRRVMIGLSAEETSEFETLEDPLHAKKISGDGRVSCPADKRNKRWLELYRKHDGAWKLWLVAQSRTGQGESLEFVNYV